MLKTAGRARMRQSIVERIARIKSIPPASIAPECTLLEALGMSSLDLAQLVAELEVELGVDPFAIDASVKEVRTVEDLYRVYDRHLEDE
jgi:acyl carrier protein